MHQFYLHQSNFQIKRAVNVKFGKQGNPCRLSLKEETGPQWCGICSCT